MRALLRMGSISTALIVLASSAGPARIAAQSQLDASQAAPFMGIWTIAIDSDFGAFQMDLEVIDHQGKVAAMIGMPEMGGPQNVTDITKDGAKLILRYEAEAQGQAFGVTIDLEPAGEGLNVGMDAADGQFYATGTATKAS